jgi:hypothetical protein
VRTQRLAEIQTDRGESAVGCEPASLFCTLTPVAAPSRVVLLDPRLFNSGQPISRHLLLRVLVI